MAPAQKIQTPDGRPMLSARKVAAYLRCAPDYVGKLCREGKLKGELIDQAWFVDPQSVEAFREARQAARAARSEKLSTERREELVSSGFVPKKTVAAAATAAAWAPLLKAAVASAAIGLVVAGSVGLSRTLPVTQEPLAAAVSQINSPFFGAQAPQGVGGDALSRWLAALFTPRAQTVQVAQTSQQPLPQIPVATTTMPAPTKTFPTQTIVQNYPVIERTVERVVASSGVSEDLLAAKLNELNNLLTSKIYQISSQTSGNAVLQFAPAQHIDNLSSVRISGATITGSSIEGYLPLTGGSLSGALSNSDTATSTFAGGIALTGGCFSVNGVCITPGASDLSSASGVLAVAKGGTGTTTAPSYGQLLVGNASGGYDLLATSSLGITSSGGSSFSTTSANYWADASSTVPKTYSANTWSALQSFANASTSLLSVFSNAYFGGTATTTIDSAGNIAGAGTLNITGLSTLAGFISTASSTVGGNLTIAGNSTTTNATTTNLFATTASSTNLFAQTATLGSLSATSLTLSTITGATQCLRVNSSGVVSGAGSDCGSGSGTFSFTSTTNYGSTANSTSTPIWFQAGLQASSTSYLANATTSLLSIIDSASPANGTLYFGNGSSRLFYNSSDYTLYGGGFYTSGGPIVSTAVNNALGLGVRYAGGNGTYYLGASGNVPDLVFTNNSSIQTARLTDGGSFAIGTTTPYAALAVVASSTASAAIVADAVSGFAGNLIDLKLASTTKFSVTQTGDVLALGSTTLQNLTFLSATGTAATTTDFFATTASSTNLFATAGTLGTLSGAGLSTCNTSTQKLLWANGSFSCGTDQTGGGAGTDVNWAFFNGSGIYVATSTNQVLIGGTATTTTLAKLEVQGGAFIDRATTTNATTTNFFATTASSTNLFAAAAQVGSLTVGSLSGFLKATAGVVSTALVDLASDVTGTLPVANGGTGSTTLASGQLLYGAGTGALQSVATSTLAVGSSLSVSGTLGYQVGGTNSTLSLNTANANTWSALQSFANASTSLLSVFSNAYFGGTATTTIDSAGNIAGAGTLNITGLSTLAGFISTASSTVGGNLTIAGNSTTTNATTTNLFATTASSTNLFAAAAQVGSLTVGSLSGFLKATAGVVSTALVDLTSDVTGILPIANGGTNASSFTTTGNAVYYDGTRLVTAGNSSVTTTYASSTALTATSLYATNFLATGSSTLQNFTALNSTSTNATTTSFFATTASSTNLFAQTATLGSLTLGAPLSIANGGTNSSSQTINGVAYYNGTSLVTGSAGLTFDGTTLAATYASSTALTATSLYATNFLATGSSTLQNFTALNSTSTNATTTSFFATTASSTNLFATAGTLGTLSGAGLSSCNGTTGKLLWANGSFSCGTDAGAGANENNWLFFNGSGIKLGTTSNQVLIGAAATTTLAALEVAGDIMQYATGNPTLATATSSTDLTYQTAVAGNYAYLAENAGGLRIIDITNPKSPTTVGRYTSITTALSVAVAGKYVYVGDTTTGLNIFDVSNPANPVKVGGHTFVGLASSVAAYSIAVSGKYVFMTDYNNGDVHILDVGDPTAPRLVKTYAIASGAPYTIAVQGKYAYVGDQGTAKIYILDISDPANPAAVGNYSATGIVPGQVYVSGKNLYVADFVKGFYIVNVSNPASPTLVGQYMPDASDGYYGVSVAGNYAYVADHQHGKVLVLDISSPASPTLVGSYTVAAGSPMSVTLAGKYAYVANYSSGLEIINTNGILTPSLSTGALAANQLNVSDSAAFGGDLTAGGGLSVGISGIFSHGTIASYIASTTAVNPTAASFIGGNVGIGTSSPYARLTIAAGPADANQQTTLFAVSSSTAAYATSTLFAILNTGNVGIGTASPSYKLDVAGFINADQFSGFKQAGVTVLYASSTTGSLQLGSGAGNSTNVLATYNTLVGYNAGANITTGANNVILGSWSTSANANLTTGSNNIQIGYNIRLPSATDNNQLDIGNLIYGTGLDGSAGTYSTGKIGIGSTTPSARLSVHANNGDTNTTLFAVASSTASATTTLFSVDNKGLATAANLLATGSTTLQNFTSLQSTSTNATSSNLFSASLSALTLAVGGTATTTLTAAGAVGIGTTSPWADLSIEAMAGHTTFAIGSSTSTYFVVNSSGNVGVGTSTPTNKLSLQNGVTTGQFNVAYDNADYTLFSTGATGDLSVVPSGNDFFLPNANAWVCTGGTISTNACPTGTPTGQGNLVVQNKIEVGTTTSLYKLAIETQDSTTDFLQIASSTNQSLFVVNANGRVGIGTSTPFTRLAVGAGGAITTVENSLTDSATITVDWSSGNQQKVTLGGNRTINFTNYVAGQILRLVVCQDGTGSRTATWDANVLWQGAAAPTLTTTANYCDLVAFVATNATSTLKIFGSAALNFP